MKPVLSGEGKLSCLGTLHNVRVEARTRGILLSSQLLYHWLNVNATQWTFLYMLNLIRFVTYHLGGALNLSPCCGVAMFGQFWCLVKIKLTSDSFVVLLDVIIGVFWFTASDIDIPLRIRNGFIHHTNSVVGPEGVQGVRLNPLSFPPPVLNRQWKWIKLVSVRKHYFIFMVYLRKMR